MGGLARKQETVASLGAELQDTQVAYVLDYRGLSDAEMRNLRRELYPVASRLTVAKNTLMRRAVQGTSFEALTAHLKGPTAIVFAKGDQIEPLKRVKDYLKKNKKENNVIRGGVMDGRVLSAAEVNELSQLPPFNELRAKLLGGIASPLNGLVASLSGPQRALVNVLDQYAKTRQS